MVTLPSDRDTCLVWPEQWTIEIIHVMIKEIIQSKFQAQSKHQTGPFLGDTKSTVDQVLSKMPMSYASDAAIGG